MHVSIRNEFHELPRVELTWINEVLYCINSWPKFKATDTVSVLGFHFRGTFSPSQQFSRCHSSYFGDTVFSLKEIKKSQVSIN